MIQPNDVGTTVMGGDANNDPCVSTHYAQQQAQHSGFKHRDNTKAQHRSKRQVHVKEKEKL